jgi:hypothetical protein
MNDIERNPSKNPCLFCNSKLGIIYVQSHYQCLNCKQVIDPCCGGEICDDFSAEINANNKYEK